MLKLLLILCTIICYFALTGGRSDYSHWAGGGFALVTIIIFLISLSIQKNDKDLCFKSDRSSNTTDRLTLTVAVLFTSALIYLLISLAPSKLDQVFLSYPVSSPSSSNSISPSALGVTDKAIIGAQPWSSEGNTITSNSTLLSSNQPEIFLEIANEEDAKFLLEAPIYIKDFSNNKFDGRLWKSFRQGIQILESSNGDSIHIKKPSSHNTRSIPHTIYRSYRPNQVNTMASLQGVHKVSGIDRITKLGNGVYQLPPPANGNSSYKYSPTSQSFTFQALTDKQLPIQPEKIHKAFTKPSSNRSLANDIARYAEQFQHHADLTSKLNALQQTLRQSCKYSLQTSELSKDAPIQDFLNNGKPGYCLHFATATTLIVREFGIPSRISYGWTGGKYYPLNRQFVFLAKEAHAWCEIHLKDYGWVCFDTTPPEATPSASTAAKDEEEPPELPTAANKELEEKADYTQSPTSPTSWAFLASILGTLTLALFILLRIRADKQSQYSANPALHTKAQLDYLQAFQTQSAKHGYPLKTGITLRQHIRMLERTELSQPFFQELLDYHYGLIYQTKLKDSNTEEQLINDIQRW